jgi:hypothetical protein
MAAELTYQLQVVAYLGPTSFLSDPLVTAVTNQGFQLENLTVSTTDTTIHASWSIPASYTDLSGIQAWIVFANSYNGYQAVGNIDLVIELRDANLSSRLLLAHNTTSLEFSGCYVTPSGDEHCIQPWTHYRVFVSPVNASFIGAPLQATVVTNVSAPVAPTNVSVVCQIRFHDFSLNAVDQSRIIVLTYLEF